MKARAIIVLLSIFISLFGFFGCSASKNLTSNTKEKGSTEEKRNEYTDGEINTLIDSTKRANSEIKYFKIEFYPPEEKPAGPGPEVEPEKEPKPGSVGNTAKPASKKPPNKGAIKSIEGYIITSSNEEKGITETQEKNTSQKDEEINTDNSIETDITEDVAEDPYKWRYIFGTLILIIVIGVGGYFLFRKSKLFAFIKNIFSS